jgi:ketosteroid isomerase-like protein
VEPGEVVTELWRRIQARDWDGVGELLAEDFVLDWPNAGLRIRGRANFVGFNRNYPEGWSIEVLRVVAEGSVAVSEVRVPHPVVGRYFALSVYEVEDGLLTRGREYWVEERYEPPRAELAEWFERVAGPSAE